MPYKDIEKRKQWQRNYYAKNKNKIRKYWNKWHKKDREQNPEKVKRQVRQAALKMNFGLSIERYEAMHKSQFGKCAICKKVDDRQLSVDHNHDTNKVRGLLCRKCNLAIAHLDENVLTLKSAINYLEKHNG